MFKISIIFLFAIFINVANAKEFEIFDGTQYSDKPNMAKYGIKPITILYESWIWKNNENRDVPPSAKRVKQLADTYDGKTDYIVIDIENWKVQGHPYRPWVIKNSISKYVQTFDTFKRYFHKSKLGYFGAILPVSNYTASIADHNNKIYKQWVNSNNNMKQLADIVDVAFPSIYTYDKDPKIWDKSFKNKITELRRIYSGKIYAFIWPQYFDHEPAPKYLNLHFIPGEFWKHQLEAAYNTVDGVIIWGGWDFNKRKRLSWDNNAEWFISTKKFIAEKRIISE